MQRLRIERRSFPSAKDRRNDSNDDIVIDIDSSGDADVDCSALLCCSDGLNVSVYMRYV
jgi:hypothetical protein